VPKFGRKVPHLWCNSHTSFKVKRSEVKVTRPIDDETHRAPYISHISHALQGQRSRDQSELFWPNAVPVSLEAGSGIPCQPNPAATLLVLTLFWVKHDIKKLENLLDPTRPRMPLASRDPDLWPFASELSFYSGQLPQYVPARFG